MKSLEGQFEFQCEFGHVLVYHLFSFEQGDGEAGEEAEEILTLPV